MKNSRTSTLLVVLFLAAFASIATAADFGWIPEFNRRAAEDLVAFRASLSARFSVEHAHIEAILTDVPSPADAYLVFRFGEMSGRPPEYVLNRYKTEKRGWGALAQSLGIKPGSSEFHALKRNHDLHKVGPSKVKIEEGRGNEGNGKGKGKGKSK